MGMKILDLFYSGMQWTLLILEILLWLPYAVMVYIMWVIQWPWLFVRAVRHYVDCGWWAPVSSMESLSWETDR